MRSWLTTFSVVWARRGMIFRLATVAVRARVARVGLAVLTLCAVSTSNLVFLWSQTHAAGATPLHV